MIFPDLRDISGAVPAIPQASDRRGIVFTIKGETFADETATTHAAGAHTRLHAPGCVHGAPRWIRAISLRPSATWSKLTLRFSQPLHIPAFSAFPSLVPFLGWSQRVSDAKFLREVTQPTPPLVPSPAPTATEAPRPVVHDTCVPAPARPSPKTSFSVVYRSSKE